MKKNTAVKLNDDGSGLNRTEYTAIIGGIERPDIRIVRNVNSTNGTVTITTTSKLTDDGTLPVPLPTMDGLVRNIDRRAKVSHSAKGPRLALRNYRIEK